MNDALKLAVLVSVVASCAARRPEPSTQVSGSARVVEAPAEAAAPSSPSGAASEADGNTAVGAAAEPEQQPGETAEKPPMSPFVP